MKLTLEGIKNREAWEKAGITLPGYDVEKVSEKARKEPEWVHFGIGNIFRIFMLTYVRINLFNFSSRTSVRLGA